MLGMTLLKGSGVVEAFETSRGGVYSFFSHHDQKFPHFDLTLGLSIPAA